MAQLMRLVQETPARDVAPLQCLGDARAEHRCARPLLLGEVLEPVEDERLGAAAPEGALVQRPPDCALALGLGVEVGGRLVGVFLREVGVELPQQLRGEALAGAVDPAVVKDLGVVARYPEDLGRPGVELRARRFGAF